MSFSTVVIIFQVSIIIVPPSLLTLHCQRYHRKCRVLFKNVKLHVKVVLTNLPFNRLAAPSTQAWVTLATNDSYALGALVMASSLRRTNTARKIVVMVTPEGLSPPMKSQLNSAFDEVVDVSLLDSKDKVNLSLMERPELGVTFTKLHCWRLVQYTKCVFLDADTMVSIIFTAGASIVT